MIGDDDPKRLRAVTKLKIMMPLFYIIINKKNGNKRTHLLEGGSTQRGVRVVDCSRRVELVLFHNVSEALRLY